MFSRDLFALLRAKKLINTIDENRKDKLLSWYV